MGQYVPLPADITSYDIDAKFAQATDMINVSKAELFAFIDQLTDVVNEDLEALDDITATFDEVYQRLDSNMPERPISPEFTFDDVLLPVQPTITQPTIDGLDDMPIYDVEPASISLPIAPDSTLPSAPSGAPTVSEIDIPAKPTVELPAVPVLADYNIPSPPDIVIPVFEGEMPVDDIVTPTNLFQWSENLYTSELLEDLKAKFIHDITEGGTGLSPEVEQAIWDREVERAEYALRDSMDKLAAEWAASGFPLPDGVLTAGQLDLQRNYQESRLTTSREIAIKQAELEQQNVHHALSQATMLEGQIMDYYAGAAQRSLEAAKVVSEIGIRIFEAQVKKYETELEAYKTLAVVFEARIRGALAIVEVYKAQIEGVRTAIMADTAKVDLYKAQISGAEALMNLYKTEMEAANIRANIEKLKLDLFRAQIEVFQAQVAAKTAEYQMYESAIKGEMAKVEIYKTQVEAYKSRVEAAKSQADVLIAEIRAQIEINNSETQIYSENIKAYSAQMDAAKTKAMTYIEEFKSEVQMFEAEAKAETDLIDASVKKYSADIEAYKADVTVMIENGKLKVTQLVEELKVKLEAARTAATVLAQIVASALSSVNASVSAQSQTSLSASLQEQHSKSAQNTGYNARGISQDLESDEGTVGIVTVSDF